VKNKDLKGDKIKTKSLAASVMCEFQKERKKLLNYWQGQRLKKKKSNDGNT